MQPRIGVGAGMVVGVATFFGMDVSGISRAPFFGTSSISAVDGYTTLVASRGLDVRAIDTEVFLRE